MAYHIYTTDALVCGSFDRGASDRSYLLYTEQFGMLYATARSVREERSRQRYALQDFALIRVSLVKGKSGWRIGSVTPLHHPFLVAADRQTRAQLLRLYKTLRRFIPGTEAAPELFWLTKTVIKQIISGHISNPEAYLVVVEARLLQELGYLSPNDSERMLLQAVPHSYDHTFDPEAINAFRQAILTAHAVSQL